MRERLIEIVCGAIQESGCGQYCRSKYCTKCERFADYLLENGVIVIDTNVVTSKNRPLITQCFDRPIDEVISAFEKQIPKKPQVTKHKFRVSEDSYETIERHMTHCPYCFWEDDALKYFESLVDKGTKYCRRCGQALDWSDTE